MEQRLNNIWVRKTNILLNSETLNSLSAKSKIQATTQNINTKNYQQNFQF